MNDFISLPDIEFQLFDVLGTAGLCRFDRYRDHDRETFVAAIELAHRIAS